MNKEFLRRYMELKYVLPLLKSGRIEFLAPNKWDDTNDSHFLEAYRQKKKLKSLLAVCFTSVSERIHHWERFGRKGKNGSEAICVEFNKATLLAAFSGNPHIRSGEVKYWRLDDLEKALRVLHMLIEDAIGCGRYEIVKILPVEGACGRFQVLNRECVEALEASVDLGGNKD